MPLWGLENGQDANVTNCPYVWSRVFKLVLQRGNGELKFEMCSKHDRLLHLLSKTLLWSPHSVQMQIHHNFFFKKGFDPQGAKLQDWEDIQINHPHVHVPLYISWMKYKHGGGGDFWKLICTRSGTSWDIAWTVPSLSAAIISRL